MPNLTDADKVLRNDTGISIANRLSEIAATLDSQGGTSLAATDIADLYDNTKTYIVGDYVINNQALYRCIEDITTPEDFDSTKWRAIKIMSAVNEEIDEAILPLRWVKTASGDVAVFDTELSDRFVDIKCSINPIQNGTPWIDSNEVNKEPYIKRAVAGTATRIGNHLYDKLVGGTVAFNQKVATYSNNASTVVDNQDGTLTVTSNARVYYFGITLEATGHAVLKTTIDHKYFFYTKILSSNIENFNNFGVGNWTDGPQNSSQLTGEFAKITRSKNDTVGTYFNVTTAGTSLSTDTFTCTKPILIDLTAMFGPTIADYIYGLEQATAGAGVAWFKALFPIPNDYYAYNAGELMSVKATPHVMKNASNTVIGNYALDSNLELRGIPKLVNNKLEYDGDTYESNGDVTRRYGIVDLGSLSYTLYTVTEGNLFRARIDEGYLPANTLNLVCAKYVTTTSNGRSNKTISVGSVGRIDIIDDDYSDKDAFKTAMNGVYLVYELATPTTEQASPFTNPQVCDENGTEEYTDSRAVAIPVGHETYQANICPITGFDELNVVRTGINVWDEEWEAGGINYSTGENEPSTTRIRSKNYIPIIENTTYYIKQPEGAGRIAFYDSDKNHIGSDSKADATFTTPANSAYMKFCTSTAYGTTYNNDISINYPTTDTTYHAYSGKLIKLEFDDTVYLAEVSCLNGVWKLKLLGAKVDLGELDWTYNSTFTVFRGNITGCIDSPAVNSEHIPMCSIYEGIKPNYATVINNAQIMYNVGGTGVYVKDTSYTDASDFKTAMNGVQLVYELATPIEITLDETEQFESLIGVNNVWHDGNGPIEVQYADNLKGYVDDALELKADKADTYTKAQVNQVAEEVPKVVEYSSELPSFIDKTITGGLEELKTDIKSLLPIATASGNPCNFETGIADKLVSLKVAILATGGNGTPDNPNPINGYSSANITRCGVNLWGGATMADAFVGARNYSKNTSTKTFDFSVWGVSPYYKIVYEKKFKSNTQYTFIFRYTATANNNSLEIHYTDSTYDRITFQTNSEKTDLVVTSASGKTIENVILNYIQDGIVTVYYEESGMFEGVKTVADFAPYNGHTYVIAFGQTVYGGVLDVTRGKLTVTHAIVDLGDLNWNYQADQLRFATQDLYNIIKPLASPNDVVNAICTDYVPTDYNTLTASKPDNSLAEYPTGQYFYVIDKRYTDATVFKSAMTGVKLVYPLATPFDIDLTPTQIRALVGENNVYSDTNGNTTVKFKDSIQHYIDSKMG